MPALAALEVPEAAQELRACPQCGARHGAAVERYSREPWRIVRCADCDFIYLENPPRTELLASEFAWEKLFEAERQRRKDESPKLAWVDGKTRWRLSLTSPDEPKIFPKLFPAGRTLDIGCGRARWISKSHVPYGIDISEERARVANERMSALGGYAIQAAAIDGLARFPDGYFTGVVMRSYLEHETDPKPVLREVVRVMTDDGSAFVRVPNYGSVNRWVMGRKWCGFRYPDHVNYFTLHSLRRMAEDCGLHFRALNPVTLPFDDNIKAVLTKPARH